MHEYFLPELLQSNALAIAGKEKVFSCQHFVLAQWKRLTPAASKSNSRPPSVPNVW